MNTRPTVRRNTAVLHGVLHWSCIAAILLHFPQDINADIDETGVRGSPPDVIAQLHGFSTERHSVTTEDGFILDLFRLPANDTEETNSRPAVLLVPGILCNAATWFLNNDKSMPYLLANEGFDVWVAAGRGVRYARTHTSLTNTSRDYWDYSFHEQGLYDVPALIDYVLEHTQRPKLQFVGYSMGAAMFLVATTQLQAYRDRVSHAYLVAPAVYLTYSTSPLVRSFPVLGALDYLLTPGGLSFENPVVRKLLEEVCSGQLTDAVCAALLGTRAPDQSEEQVKFNYQYFPDATSAKTLLHYSQGQYKERWFRQFDNGILTNLQVYGSITPPSYPLSSATVPTSVFYGADDILVGVKSAEQLIEDLPNVKRAVKVAGLTHVDVMFGRNARESLYEPLVKAVVEDSV
ncbi:lipase 3-like [Thrips palmi]|uniref:Lipase n=1 Tax=Thrips palmi TaxID=161013 RepID=A0A6P8YFY7_THRPL|nr:lipase 3-like [Thrips palmi]